ncbi:MAG TPA: efflux RND transporter periplasmic adaptor subunit [Candidatus Pacearchaeota archaeon]|nr:efflux RND transporter periplasmic adaptor subunit [Candidatus Pacearchaeota archaeon]HPR79935.1 efflux RND transporter periplasmic adaptor subunit [Candidatus Pacearchaeota archaeon]
MAKIKNIISNTINLFSKIKTFALGHKILSVFILVVIVSSPFVVNYFLPHKTTISYVTQSVKKGNISVSVSGTGQVSSLKDVDLTAEVSGNITGVYVIGGEKVTKGDVLFRINSTDGQQNVKSAEIALESAELALEEMQEPVDELTLIQAENALTDAQESKTKTESNLEKSYDDGFTDVSNAFLDLPSIVTGIYSVLFSTTASSNGCQQNIDYYTTAINYYEGNVTQYRDDVYDKYIIAKKKYDEVLSIYKTTSHYSDKETIESLITQTYDATKAIAESIKSSTDFIEYYKYIMSEKQQSYSSVATANISSLSGYSSKVNSHISSLLSAKSTIEDSKNSIISAERSIKVKELSLEKVKEGATDLEIRTQKLAVEEKEQNLSEAKNTLAKYTITAPFSGTISTVNVDKGDTANSGTIMGSIITQEKIATITLNEVDIAKVKVGQKVDITFDALDGVTIQGEVAEVDAVGTVSQGVVSYGVQISFGTDNESIKPGMSISANIIIDSVSDVLTVPSAAVKTVGGKSYVQVMNSSGKIERKIVETGLTDDATIEIKSGLSEGDKVVTSTNSGSGTKTTTTKTTTTTNQGGPGGGSDMMMLTR